MPLLRLRWTNQSFVHWQLHFHLHHTDAAWGEKEKRKGEGGLKKKCIFPSNFSLTKSVQTFNNSILYSGDLAWPEVLQTAGCSPALTQQNFTERKWNTLQNQLEKGSSGQELPQLNLSITTICWLCYNLGALAVSFWWHVSLGGSYGHPLVISSLCEPTYTLRSPQQHSCPTPWSWYFPGAGLQLQSETPWSGLLVRCQSHPWLSGEVKGKRKAC